MIDKNQLLDLCEHGIKTAEGLGATAVEAQAKSSIGIESNIELSQISSVNRRNLDGIAVRVFVGQKMGSAFTNIPTKKSIEDSLFLALKAAKASTPDEDWSSLPKPENYPDIKNLWDDAVPNCESAKIVEYAEDLMTRVIKSESGIIPVSGGSVASAEHFAFANNNGITHSEKRTLAFIHLAVIAQIESGVTPVIGSYDINRKLEFNLERVVEDITSMIMVCKNTVRGKTGSKTVIFHPNAYSQLLYYTLIQSIRGDNIARGKSILVDKIGEEVASDKVTLIDDGTIPEGIRTSMSDDEGVPRKRTPIIKKGILNSFIWDNYWARKMNKKSTGNASRNIRQGQVEITPSTILVNPGKREIHEIISELNHGYLIRGVQGAHSSNPESGDFSIVGNPAILIENGEYKGAIHGLMVTGNIFELLRNVREVARNPIVLHGLIGPEIVCDKVTVINRN
jgi:PmbA protein